MRYRVSFEAGDPTMCAGLEETYGKDFPNYLIPYFKWRTISRESEDKDDLLDQYRQLKRWSDAGTSGVRNPRLEVSEMVWKEFWYDGT